MRTARDDDDLSEDRTSVTEAMILGRHHLIAGLAGLNEQLEETSRLLAPLSPPPPAPETIDDLEYA